jgi:diguanylate cyclase (GGDEF)-like protein
MRASASFQAGGVSLRAARLSFALPAIAVIAGIVAIAIAASGPQVELAPRAGRPLPMAEAGAMGAVDAALDILPAPPVAGGHRVAWARLRVTAASDSPAAWTLVPDRGWLRVTLFDGARPPLVTGIDVPLTDRPIDLGIAALPVAIEPGRAHTWFVRFEGDLDGWEPPAGYITALAPARHFEMATRRGALFLGIYAGLLLAVTFVNLLFGRILRDVLFINYVAYAVPYASIWVFHEWTGAELLWPAHPAFDKYLLFVAISSAIVLGNRFAIRFLDMRIHLPRLRVALFGVDGAVAIAVALAALGQWRLTPFLLGWTAVVTCVIYLFAGSLLTARGHRYGRYFLAATGTLAVGTLIYTLRSFDLIPAWPLTDRSAQIGSAAEMMLLALALADRVRLANRARRAAEANLRSGLEREVHARTTALARANRQLVEANRRLEALSLTDPLTGVANRRRFETVLEDECRRAQRERSPLAVLLVDVDLFKDYNDAYGHQAGDDCLRRVADVLSTGARRAGDVLARYGGEEFVLILPSMAEDTALTHADRLREAVAALELEHARSPIAGHVTVSIGVAVLATGDADSGPGQVISAADGALYRAKRAGRDRVALAEPAPGASVAAQSMPIGS